MSEDDAGEPGIDAESGVESRGETGSGGADEASHLSEWTREWLEERAAEQDVSPGELLKRFAAAFRAAEEGDVPNLAYQDDLAALDDELAALTSDLDDLENAVEELDADVAEKIQDVRERVIQVKREADAKAPADHTHPDLAEQVSSVAETAATTQDRLEDLSATVQELDTTVDELDTTVDSGFENFEEILEYLTDAVDDVEARNEQLAGAIVSMRETVQGVAEREGRRIAADRLRETANENGIRTADCGDCGATLDVALLTDARCPHCKSTFANLEPSRGFFGSPTLEVGDRPALEAADVDEADPLAPSTDTDAVADGNGRSVGDRARDESDSTVNGTDIRPGSASESGEDGDR